MRETDAHDAHVPSIAYYANFFSRAADADENDPKVAFEATQVRPVYKSFMDSIVMELCLPDSEFSVNALIYCLHMVQEESPRETKRCPQAMWDAISALSVSIKKIFRSSCAHVTDRMHLNYWISLRRRYLLLATILGKPSYLCRPRRLCNGKTLRQSLWAYCRNTTNL